MIIVLMDLRQLGVLGDTSEAITKIHINYSLINEGYRIT